jgi:hypothetical protein
MLWLMRKLSQSILALEGVNVNSPYVLANGTAPFKKCKQLLQYQHFLLVRDIWWSKL